MKTKLLLLSLLVGASLFTFAQSLVVIHEGEELAPNAIIDVEGDETAVEIVIEFDVKNTSGSTIEANIQRYEEPLYDGHVSTFCWAGLCYPPFVGLSPNTVLIDGGATHEDDFSGHLNPNGVIGTSIIKYTFFDVNNESDSVQVVINFLAGTSGVDKFNSEKFEVSTFPNPVSNVLNFSVGAAVNDVITFELLSITGKTVRNEVTTQNEVKFNVSELAEGLYLYRVSTNNNMIKTGRVVIKH